MPKKRGLPPTLFVPTQGLHGPREAYELVLLRVETWNEDGTPFMVSIGRENDVMELSRDKEQNHFITAYMRQGVTRDNVK